MSQVAEILFSYCLVDFKHVKLPANVVKYLMNYPSSKFEDIPSYLWMPVGGKDF